jgi:CheY-like chemotaxis protein
MPVMDGWQFRERQQLDARLLFIPVVVISAESSGPKWALALGAEAYCRKPVDVEALLETVALYCGPPRAGPGHQPFVPQKGPLPQLPS